MHDISIVQYFNFEKSMNKYLWKNLFFMLYLVIYFVDIWQNACHINYWVFLVAHLSAIDSSIYEMFAFQLKSISKIKCISIMINTHSCVRHAYLPVWLIFSQINLTHYTLDFDFMDLTVRCELIMRKNYIF